MKSKGFIGKFRLHILLMVVIGFVVVLLFSAGGFNGLVQLYRLNKEVAAAEGKLRAAEASIDSLSKEIIRLKTDTAYIEKIARERLGMARKNEKVFRFVDKK